MAIELQHWIEHLNVDPAFAQYEAELAGAFDRAVQTLLDYQGADPLVVAEMVGELRGMRAAMRTPSRLTRLARET